LPLLDQPESEDPPIPKNGNPPKLELVSVLLLLADIIASTKAMNAMMNLGNAR
jgi:hypothetical protein